MGCCDCSCPRHSHWRRAHSFLKPSLGVKSEYRFQDTVEKHVFPHFSTGVRPVHNRSQCQGLRNKAACLDQGASECRRIAIPKSHPETQVKIGGRKSPKTAYFSAFSDKWVSLYVPLSKGTRYSVTVSPSTAGSNSRSARRPCQ